MCGSNPAQLCSLDNIYQTHYSQFHPYQLWTQDSHPMIAPQHLDAKIGIFIGALWQILQENDSLTKLVRAKGTLVSLLNVRTFESSALLLFKTFCIWPNLFEITDTSIVDFRFFQLRLLIIITCLLIRVRTVNVNAFYFVFSLSCKFLNSTYFSWSSFPKSNA